MEGLEMEEIKEKIKSKRKMKLKEKNIFNNSML